MSKAVRLTELETEMMQQQKQLAQAHPCLLLMCYRGVSQHGDRSNQNPPREKALLSQLSGGSSGCIGRSHKVVGICCRHLASMLIHKDLTRLPSGRNWL